jgi:hypothetical protein
MIALTASYTAAHAHLTAQAVDLAGEADDLTARVLASGCPPPAVRPRAAGTAVPGGVARRAPLVADRPGPRVTSASWRPCLSGG